MAFIRHCCTLAAVPDEVNVLPKGGAARFDCVEVYATELTPVVGAHTGPGVLGVAFLAE